MIDPFGRSINYLRISVTDRCNLRCVYCMPPQGVPWKPMQEILTFEEITQVVAAAAKLGIRKVRLTGGEPLVRRGVPDLVRLLNSIPGVEEVSLTTNGMLLDKLAKPLAEAGLKRVNVSLDTLVAEKFRLITRGGDITRVWSGIAAAEAANLAPIKINTVVVRGINENELVPLARLTLANNWHIRFIELMPVGNFEDWGQGFPKKAERYLPIQEMRDILTSLNLIPAEGPFGNGPARTYRIPAAQGTVGFISPLGEHFCAACNRLRLTADGRLRPCLMNNHEVELREALYRGESVEENILRAVSFKPHSHRLNDQSFSGEEKKFESGERLMAQIGG